MTRHAILPARILTLAAFLAPFLAALAFPAGFVRAAPTQYVSSTFDGPSTATDCTNPNDGCSLRDALHAAAAGDTVSLPPGNVLTLTVILAAGPLTINQDVTINGGGLLIVDGGHVSRVFTITGGTVVMDGVTVQHGQTSDRGAGIYEQAGNLTLTNCVVTGNTVSGTGRTVGGGIDTNTNLTLTNTTVSGNTVTNPGTTTADQALGGGIGQDGGTLTVTASTIRGNKAEMTAPNASTQLGGGGIFSGDTLHMDRSTVSGNQTIGAIAIDAGGGMLLLGVAAMVTNSTIATNTAGNEGGGILLSQETLILTSSTVTGNTAPAGGGLINFGSVTLIATLIASNTDFSGTPDVQGAVVGTSSNNLIGDGANTTGISNGSQGNQIGTHATPLNPKLDPNGLHANGGATMTVALLPNSPTIEAGGACVVGVTQDQRGLPRVGNCDIGAYEYQPVMPTLNNATAPVSGGNVTFHGTGFQTLSQLTIGSAVLNAPASAVSNDGTQMTLTIPARAVGIVGSALLNPGGHGTTGTVTYIPIVSGASPASGGTAGGSTVTIFGAGFGTNLAQVGVKFGATSATVKTVSDTQLAVTVPAGSGTVDVTVTVTGISGMLPTGYTYGAVNALPAPQPPGAPAGTGGVLPSPRTAASPSAGSPPQPLPASRP